MIDREKVIKGLEKCKRCECDDCTEKGASHAPWDCPAYDDFVDSAIALLKEQEPVVRCKDCKHYAVEDHYGNSHGYEILAASDVPTCHRWGNDAVMVKPDGYCFLGERR